MLYIPNACHDPHYNLALEEYVLKRLSPQETYVLLWQNEPSVIVGRFQNTPAEINHDFIKSRGIHVVRRMTGGGAVYHDLGNLNFTFIENKQSGQLDFRRFTEPVVQALAQMGVTAELSGRNDLTIEGKKFSGNAQYHDKNRTMHHGTLLFAANLDDVQAALRVKEEKFVSKGVKSVRSRITNISEHLPQSFSLEEFRENLLVHLFQGEPVRKHHLSSEEVAEIKDLRDKKYHTWDWNYGQSPRFNLQKSGRFLCGGIEVCIQVETGIIRGCKIYGDFFSNEDIGNLEQRIVGLRYEEAILSEVLQQESVERYFGQVSTEEVLELFFA